MKMENTLLKQFIENPKILDENYKIKKLNACEDNSFEVTTELIDELDIPKQNQNVLNFPVVLTTGIRKPKKNVVYFILEILLHRRPDDF